MKKTLLTLVSCLTLVATQYEVSAHCQIPCGIYNDSAVFSILMTDADTVEKAMTQIIELSKDPSKNAQQITRWVTNKESHAQHIQEEMSAYFLSQRIKTTEKDSSADTYAKKLALVHQITVLAMKCKQGTDVENAKKLHKALKDFKTLYEAK